MTFNFLINVSDAGYPKLARFSLSLSVVAYISVSLGVILGALAFCKWAIGFILF